MGGAYGSENVGISNRNTDEISVHRKPEVSWATDIVPGLVGPKARLKSVVDGQQVNIPALHLTSEGGTQFSRLSVLLDLHSCSKGAL